MKQNKQNKKDIKDEVVVEDSPKFDELPEDKKQEEDNNAFLADFMRKVSENQINQANKYTFIFGMLKYYIVLFFFVVDLIIMTASVIKNSPINWQLEVLNLLVLSLFLVLF